jgi:hypothetical protein
VCGATVKGTGSARRLLIDTHDQDYHPPLDVAQWDFYVLPTAVQESDCAEQKTITLGTLRWYAPIQAKYAGLREAEGQRVGKIRKRLLADKDDAPAV